MKTLPNKPSALLKLALNDYFLVKEDPRYTINMEVWHDSSFEDDTCHVCLAGSVLAKSMETPTGKFVTPWGYPNEIYRKLVAIDSFREGNIQEALKLLGCSNNKLPEYYFSDFEKETEIPLENESLEDYIQDLIGLLETKGL